MLNRQNEKRKAPLVNLALVAAALALGACAGSGGSRPDWVDRPASAYSEGDYMSAVGSADNRESANAAALANLAREFEVSISDSSHDTATAIVRQSGEGRQVENTQRAGRSVTAFAQQVLEGAEVVQHWRERGDLGDTHYSLAILERDPAARRLRDEIRQLDRRIGDVMDYARRHSDRPVRVFSAWERARQWALEREALNRNLTTVSGSGLSARTSTDELLQSIRSGLAALSVVGVADSAEWQSVLSGGLEALGIADRAEEEAEYRLLLEVDSSPVEFRQKWHWLRGGIEFTLLRGDQVMATQRHSFKVSATEEHVVEQRAREQMMEQMPDYLYSLLTSAVGELPSSQ